MSLTLVLADHLGIPERDLSYIIRSAPFRYKVYTIPKKGSNKHRTIAQPAKEVKVLQRWVVSNILKDYPVHEAAEAYVKGKNIEHNVSIHSINAFILKIDFKDFFPSIKPHDFELHTKKYGPKYLKPEDINSLMRILFWYNREAKENQLSIGGPSSPMVSNTIMYDFDSNVCDLCARKGVTYTRYADDLTFSTNEKNVLRSIESNIIKISEKMRYPKLVINSAKTVHVSKKHSRRVTGLIITNDCKVSLGRDRKRLISAEVHSYKYGKLNIKDTLRLKGHLGFALDVEPSFVTRLNKKYGSDIITELLKLDHNALKQK